MFSGESRRRHSWVGEGQDVGGWEKQILYFASPPLDPALYFHINLDIIWILATFSGAEPSSQAEEFPQMDDKTDEIMYMGSRF